MATYSQRCSAVGGYSYAENFTLYVILNEVNVDVSNNTSQIQYNVYCQSSGSGSINARHLKYFNLNGQDIINSTEDINASSPNAYIPIASGTTGKISHNSDGTKSVSFSAQIQASSYGVSASTSGAFTLSTIPRASGISCTTANIEETAIITINKASPNFVHTVTYEFGTLSGTIVTKTANTNISWTLPSSFYTQIPNNKMGAGTLRCFTYNGNTEVGQTAILFYINTNEEKCKPSISANVIDTNTTTIALTGSNTKLIKYKSTAQATITATAKNSATISQKTINGTVVSGNVLNIQNVSTNVFNFSTTDSRGYTNSMTKTLTMVEYVPLTINANIFRPQPTTGQVNLSFTGNYFNGNFGTTNNTLSIQWFWKESSDTDWTGGGTITPTISGNTFRSNGNISLGTSYDYQKSYNFYLLVKDKLTTLQPTFTISVGIPIVNWGKDYFNVNGEIRQNDKNIDEIYLLGKTVDSISSFNEVSSTGSLRRSFLGTVNQNYIWYNLINLRHRNGESDGLNYGLQIRNEMLTNNSKLQVRQQNSGSWGSWRTLQEEATTLYSNASGTAGTIALSEAANNFDYLEVYYGNDTNVASQKIESTNGETLQCSITDSSNNTEVLPLQISDTNVTVNQNYALNSENQTTSNNLKVFKILGYR